MNEHGKQTKADWEDAREAWSDLSKQQLIPHQPKPQRVQSPRNESAEWTATLNQWSQKRVYQDNAKRKQRGRDTLCRGIAGAIPA